MRSCTRWVVTHITTNSTRYLSFSENNDDASCLYNLVTVRPPSNSSLDSTFCGTTLYIGYFTFEFNMTQNLVIECPNNYKWQRYCDCYTNTVCPFYPAGVEYLPMNPPTLHKKKPTDCPDMCAC